MTRDLGEIFQRQLIYGCELIHCDNKYCANCDQFVLLDKLKLERSIIARELSLRPDANRYICRYQNIKVTNPEFITIIDNFHKFAEEFTVEMDPSTIINNISPIFTNLSLFGQIFTLKSDDFDKYNFNIDDKRFYDFSSKLSAIPALNDQLCNLIRCLISEIISMKKFRFKTALRCILTIFYFPTLLNPHCFQLLDCLIATLATKLDKDSLNVLSSNLASVPNLMRQMLGVLHFCITDFYSKMLGNKAAHNGQMWNILCAMRIIAHANDMASNPIPSSSFYSHHINESIAIDEELNKINDPYSSSLKFSFLEFPFVISLKIKSQIIEYESKIIMETAAVQSLLIGFINDGLISNSDIYLNLRVRRDHLIDDTMNQLTRKPATEWLKRLKVVFEGESAVDIGGPSREFIYLLTEKLFSTDYGMFTPVNGKCLWFSPLSAKIQDDSTFTLYGLVVGLACHNNILLPVRFPKVLYKKLLGYQRFTLSDLAEIDPNVGQGLMDITDKADNDEDISSYCLTFTYDIDVFGTTETIELVPNGKNIEVTNGNVRQYISEVLNMVINKLHKQAFDSFERGFRICCRASTYRKLSAEELDMCVSGEEVLDWGALMRTCIYSGYNAKSKTVIYFWEYFESLSAERKLKLLKFITGTDRAPLGGLGCVRLVIKRSSNTNRFPTAHTCFNTLDLPDYGNKSVLVDKMDKAIDMTEGFGIV